MFAGEEVSPPNRSSAPPACADKLDLVSPWLLLIKFLLLLVLLFSLLNGFSVFGVCCCCGWICCCWGCAWSTHGDDMGNNWGGGWKISIFNSLTAKPRFGVPLRVTTVGIIQSRFRAATVLHCPANCRTMSWEQEIHWHHPHCYYSPKTAVCCCLLPWTTWPFCKRRQIEFSYRTTITFAAASIEPQQTRTIIVNNCI